MEAQLIREEMRQRFDGLHRRLDDIIGRLDQINGRVGKAHDRAAKLEAITDDIKGAIAYLRKRVFHLEQHPRGENGGDGARITRGDLKWIAAIASGAVALTLGVLKLVGKI